MSLAFIIIGTDYFTWGSEQTPQQMQCGNCGRVTNFIMKKGMRFVTIFFVIPIIPISGINQLIQCPHCGIRYQPTA